MNKGSIRVEIANYERLGVAVDPFHMTLKHQAATAPKLASASFSDLVSHHDQMKSCCRNRR